MADSQRKRKADAEQDARERFLKAVKLYCWALRDAADIHKADKEIVLTAVRQDGDALQWAAESC
eukprot:1035994-Amphidinium_carterae.1